ncbi:hypothetical protein ACFU6I_28205 [Streptomyces sp. NPDC057486]|uniref:hypothetical protein n=1 Tax=Streptomyces sp. NPDC057486 TaxID=3346145 RepID=UPI0036838FFC
MPRRPPAAVRRGLRHRHRPWESRAVVPGLSMRALTELAHAERERFWPGAAYEAFRHWRQLADIPGQGVLYPLRTGVEGLVGQGDHWGPEAWRGVLDVLLHALSPHCARELRAVLAPLDERFLRHTLNDPAAGSADTPWWLSRLKYP